MQNRIILRKYDMGGAFGNLLGFHSSENCQPARHSSTNYQQLSACWESDCCLCHSAKMFGESNPWAEVVQKKLHDII